MLHPFRDHRRKLLRAQPFPEAWQAILERDVAYAAQLDAEERRELEGLVQIFLEEKHFEGCGGLELTDRIRVTIAAEACRLLLHRETDIYPQLVSVLVSPSAYKATRRTQEGRVVIEREDALLGESRMRDAVVLSWDHVLESAHHMGGGNVVLHELAHQLDAEDGAMDGAPALGDRARYASWARVLGEEFAELSERLHDGRRSDIDGYGATNPAEFFAVITEMFFERGAQLKERHPELYGELEAFYHQDPAARHAPT